MRSRLDAAPVRHFDGWLVGAAVGLVAVGLLMVYSTTRHRIPGDDLYFVKRQGMFVVVGLTVMAGVIAVDYRRLRDFSLVGYLGTLVALLAVLAPLGSNLRGQQSWFQLPGGFTLQPSEFAKFGIIVALAGYCNHFRGELDAWRLTTIVVLAAFPIGLVLLQPDLGTVLVFAVIIGGLLAMAGLTGKQLVVLGLLAATGIYAITAVGVLKQYQVDRLTVVFDSSASDSQSSAYNQEQSQQAIANGRVTGEGFGKGSQTQNGFVPEQHTDFIFTAVSEELGFVGGAGLLGLFAVVMWRIWRTARLSRDFYGTLVCSGVLAMLAFQMFENVGMTMGIMPVTGIPLPLVSYGGSSIIATLACIGLVVNVSMRRFT